MEPIAAAIIVILGKYALDKAVGPGQEAGPTGRVGRVTVTGSGSVVQDHSVGRDVHGGVRTGG